jgi:hypothetical protein
MKAEQGAGWRGDKAQESFKDLAALTRLMGLSCRVADYAQKQSSSETKLGMDLMDIADNIAEEVGVWAARSGYTLDEVTRPLWAAQTQVRALS